MKEKFKTYEEYLEHLDKVEIQLGELPEISSRGTRLFPGPTLDRPIGIEKSLTKMAIEGKKGRLDQYKYNIEKAYIDEKVDVLNRDLEIIQEEIKYGEITNPTGNPDEKIGNRGMLMNLAVEAMGAPGIVVDTDVAARTSCRCYRVDETEMCFSKGIIGTMSKAQVEAYCPTKVYLEQGLQRRIRAFKEAAAEAKKEIAGIPRGERLEPWLREMSKALSKRGIEI